MTWLVKLIVTASIVELVVGVVAYFSAGPMALAGAMAGSGIAVAAQIAAIVMMRPGMTAPGPEFMKRWAGGIAARGFSFVAVAAVLIAGRNVLPPIWVATGYLALLLTLLFAETVFLK